MILVLWCVFLFFNVDVGSYSLAVNLLLGRYAYEFWFSLRGLHTERKGRICSDWVARWSTLLFSSCSSLVRLGGVALYCWVKSLFSPGGDALT